MNEAGIEASRIYTARRDALLETLVSSLRPWLVAAIPVQCGCPSFSQQPIQNGLGFTAAQHQLGAASCEIVADRRKSRAATNAKRRRAPNRPRPRRPE